MVYSRNEVDNKGHAINIMEPVKASLILGEQKTFVNKNNISEQQIANCFQ